MKNNFIIPGLGFALSIAFTALYHALPSLSAAISGAPAPPHNPTAAGVRRDTVYPISKINVVMLGDSLTFNANWNRLMGRMDIVNLGVPGDTTAGILQRLEYVYDLHPKVCFIMGGINDISSGRTEDEIMGSYKTIVAGLKEHGIIPVVQSTLCTARDNPEVLRLNKLLRSYCAANGIEYVDLNEYMSRNGRLIGDYTWDGVHLSDAGYNKWEEKVLPLVNEYADHQERPAGAVITQPTPSNDIRSGAPSQKMGARK